MSNSLIRNTAVKDRAVQITTLNYTEKFDDLVNHLNGIGVTSKQGNPYKTKTRGGSSVVRTAWHYYTQAGDHTNAKIIAESFTDRNGNFAYNL